MMAVLRGCEIFLTRILLLFTRGLFRGKVARMSSGGQKGSPALLVKLCRSAPTASGHPAIAAQERRFIDSHTRSGDHFHQDCGRTNSTCPVTGVPIVRVCDLEHGDHRPDEFKRVARAVAKAPLAPELNHRYVMHFLNITPNAALLSDAFESAWKTLNLSELAKFPVPLPDREQQDAITILVGAVSELDAAEPKKLDQLAQARAALSLALLTGRVLIGSRERLS